MINAENWDAVHSLQQKLIHHDHADVGGLHWTPIENQATVRVELQQKQLSDLNQHLLEIEYS